jgi:chromosomal replication initiator protein
MDNNTIKSIVFNEVRNEYGLSISHIRNKTRISYVREARQVFTQLMREHSSMSTTQIGRLVNRDHSTVIATTKAVRRELDTNALYRNRYSKMKFNIESKIENV